MFTDEFNFELPEHLIAQEPSKVRGEDKLLVLDSKTGTFLDKAFQDIVDFIPKDALMIFNNSKVRKARTYAIKESSGARVEFLFLRAYEGGKKWSFLTNRGKRQHFGDRYVFDDGTIAILRPLDAYSNSESSEKCLEFESPLSDEWFDKNGHIPLPPYIKREDTDSDATRYQNVYAKEIGSVACPTAGLHFTEDLLSKLDSLGIRRMNVTLHVGLGTFLPVRAEKIEEHNMHSEAFYISDEVAAAVEEHKSKGKPILAVGTTSVRALETAFVDGKIKSGWQNSNIFIYPPYKFKVVDALLTNFHTPKSTLLMLVSALAGKENIFNSYAHAIQKEYRFFSYGDAMLIL